MPTITDDEAPLVVKALEHYHAYLLAAKREDRAFQELADRLKRRPVEVENAKQVEKRKKV